MGEEGGGGGEVGACVVRWRGFRLFPFSFSFSFYLLSSLKFHYSLCYFLCYKWVSSFAWTETWPPSKNTPQSSATPAALPNASATSFSDFPSAHHATSSTSERPWMPGHASSTKSKTPDRYAVMRISATGDPYGTPRFHLMLSSFSSFQHEFDPAVSHEGVCPSYQSARSPKRTTPRSRTEQSPVGDADDVP